MAKPKPFVEEIYEGLQIAVVITFSRTYLVVDGMVCDTYKGVVTSSFKLQCEVNDVNIVAEFKMQICGLVLYLYCNDTLITKKWHIF